MAANESLKLPLAIIQTKCDHTPEKRVIATYAASMTVVRLFCEAHGPFDPKKYTATAKGKGTSDEFDLDWGLTVGDLVHMGIKTLRYTCVQTHCDDEEEDGAADATPCQTRVNAFEKMMATSRERFQYIYMKNMCQIIVSKLQREKKKKKKKKNRPTEYIFLAMLPETNIFCFLALCLYH